ncbi:MAG: DUF5667 domain-containing protein [Candidatus Paceibacterota bacterium]|jgi:hypothetical protein
MKMDEFKKLKKIKLSDYEKRNLFNRISNSIKEDGENVELHYPIPSPFFRFSSLLENKRSFVLVFSVFFLFLISTTVFASFNTLPGDLLYGVKINVTEKISDLTYLTPESRAEHNLRKIERRINEFEKLAEKGRLTEENTKKIEKDVDKNFGDFDHNLGQIKKDTKENKNRLGKMLRSDLQKHTEKIKKIREDKKVSNKRALQSVIERVHSSDSE